MSGTESKTRVHFTSMKQNFVVVRQLKTGIFSFLSYNEKEQYSFFQSTNLYVFFAKYRRNMQETATRRRFWLPFHFIPYDDHQPV